MTTERDDAVDVVERELDLRSGMPFVESEAQLHHLLAIARHVDFRAGEHLFERNAPIDRIFVITAGDVEMVADDSPSWRMSGSSAIGFLDFMMGRPHGRTAIARGDVRALEIDAGDYTEYLQDHIDLGAQALAKVSATLFDAMLASPDPARLLGRPPIQVPFGDPTLVERLLALSRVPAFARATVQSLANLAQNARLVRYAPNREIATAGVRYETVSILLSGEVDLACLGVPTIRRGAGDLLCDVAELATVPRRVSVRGVTETVVLQIDREELLDRMDEHFEVAQSLFAYVAGQREQLNMLSAASGSI